MNLHWIDWVIVACLFAFLIFLAVGTKKYMVGVADFLAANRCAGRYLLSVAQGIASMGAISIVGVWEMYYEAGFTPAWWSMMGLPVGMFIAVTGYVIYRYRQTRAMTMAQFFEIRYSRKFRIFAGLIAFLCGILNFGIFPAVGSRFFIYFCGLPTAIPVFGYQISTFVVIMIFLLSTSVCFTYIGGQIAVLLTDFFQGLFCNLVFLIVLCFILLTVDWSEVGTSLTLAPEGKSLIDPLGGGRIENFNMWYFIIGVGAGIYTCMAWQGTQGYYCSATSPHEAKMAGILGQWRGMIQTLLFMLLPVLAYTLMHHSNYSLFADSVNQTLRSIANEDIRNSMTVPVVLARFLPVGIRGALCAVMLAAFISTHDTYLHSWGSIFIQDVIMPFHKRTLEPKHHILLLRLSVVAVAVFIFIFSLVFKRTQNILMYFALTGTIYLAGAGSVILGGLYWKRGTTSGAWGAMITGSIMAVGAFTLRQLWPIYYGHNFPINSQYLYAIAIGSAILIYVVLSLLENKVFNMDKMLHRGKYAIGNDRVNNYNAKEELASQTGRFKLILNKLGMTREFTFRDKIVFFATIIWCLSWFSVFIIGTMYGLFSDLDNSSWLSYWKIYSWIIFLVGCAITIWFAIGGSMNLIDMFARLRMLVRNDRDDGMVIDHHNRDEHTCDSNSMK